MLCYDLASISPVTIPIYPFRFKLPSSYRTCIFLFYSLCHILFTVKSVVYLLIVLIFSCKHSISLTLFNMIAAWCWSNCDVVLRSKRKVQYPSNTIHRVNPRIYDHLTYRHFVDQFQFLNLHSFICLFFIPSFFYPLIPSYTLSSDHTPYRY